MKRSGQIALVLMGVTTATAVGAYVLPSRDQCRTTPSMAAKPSAATPSTATGQPCRSSSSSSSGGRSWFWNSGSHSSNTTPGTSATQTALAPASRPSAPATSSTTSRGGFGSTGSSFFSSGG